MSKKRDVMYERLFGEDVSSSMEAAIEEALVEAEEEGYSRGIVEAPKMDEAGLRERYAYLTSGGMWGVNVVETPEGSYLAGFRDACETLGTK